MFALLLTTILCCTSRASENKLTLHQAVAYALTHSPQIEIAQSNFSLRGLEYKNEIARFLPTFDLSAAQGLQNNIPIGVSYPILTPNTAAPWFSALRLQLSETLYDSSLSFIRIQLANMNRQIAELSIAKARGETISNVVTEFYNYSLQAALQDVRQQQLGVLQKQFDFLSKQYQQGLKPRLDYLRFKTQVQRAEIEKTNAENGFQVSSANLHKLLGVPIYQAAQIEFEPVPVQPVAQVLERVSTQTPHMDAFYDSRIAVLQKEANEQNVTLAKRKFWPQIKLSGGVTYSNLDYLNLGSSFSASNQLNYSALLTVDFNILDWGSRRRDIDIASVARDIRNNELDLTLLDAKARLTQLMVDVARIKKNYPLSQELLRAEEQNYQTIQMQYREGKVAFLDLITTLNSLLDAKIQFLSRHFEALQVLARYYYFEGSIHEKF